MECFVCVHAWSILVPMALMVTAFCGDWSSCLAWLELNLDSCMSVCKTLWGSTLLPLLLILAQSASFSSASAFHSLTVGANTSQHPQSQTPEPHACGFEKCRCAAQIFREMFSFNMVPPKNSTSVVGKYPAGSSVRQHFKAARASREKLEGSQGLNQLDCRLL